METAAGTPEANTAFSGRTAWVRNLETPLRTFLRTETGSAAVLLAGVIAALVWANVAMPSYAHVWEKTTLSIHRGVVYAVIGVATWIALSKSGVDPVVVGLAMGLLTYAGPAARTDLERASDLFRMFREQPTPELARSAQAGVGSAIT